MSSENSLLDLFKVAHVPDDDKPWVELEYTHPEDIHKFIDMVNGLSNPPRLSPENVGWLFRGQANSSWTLTPRLWRELKSLYPEDADDKRSALRIEYDSIMHFRERAIRYLDSRVIPHERDPGGWLTLMQHYRVPTRMLDWTTSLTVALWFATADHFIDVRERDYDGSWCSRRENQPGAVWFFDHSALRSYMIESRMGPYPKERYADIFKDLESFITSGLGDDARPNIWPTFPDKPTDRMIAQSSIHLFSETPLCDYGLMIGKALAKPGSQLVKLIVPRDAKPKLRGYLHTVGVSAATLFPGLDGMGDAIASIIRAERDAVVERRPADGDCAC